MARTFAEVELKIDWANKHITNLQSCIEDFLQTEFYTADIKRDEKTGQDVFYFGWRKPIPPDIALITGDAVHNLRTALQFMFCDVVGNINDDFPMYGRGLKGDRKRLEKAVNNGIKRKWPASVAKLLLGTIKPHPTWYDSLWAIHRLDIADKHHLLIPMMGVSTATADVIDKAGNLVGSVTTPEVSIRSGQSVSTIGTSISVNFGDIKFRNDRKPPFQILFDKGLPMESHPVVPTLHQLSELVRETVKLFERV